MLWFIINVFVIQIFEDNELYELEIHQFIIVKNIKVFGRKNLVGVKIKGHKKLN